MVAGRGLLGFFGFASFFVFSTFLFGSVRSVLNRVLQVKQERSFVNGMGVDLMMMMGLTALLLLLGIVATWSLTVAGALMEQNPSWEGLLHPGLAMSGKVIGVTVTLLLFHILYRFPPAATNSNRALMIASVTRTVLFLTKWGFAWYVAAAQANIELYGAVGALMFLFLWLYYASVVLLSG